MESRGAVEGFNNALTKYNCYYLEYIADGGSSTADALVQFVSYGTYIKKISCVNHIVKVSKYMENTFWFSPILCGLVQHQYFSMREY